MRRVNTVTRTNKLTFLAKLIIIIIIIIISFSIPVHENAIPRDPSPVLDVRVRRRVPTISRDSKRVPGVR